MIDIEENIRHIQSILPDSTALVAVSKYHPANCIRQAYATGQRIFGESRTQEMLAKQQELKDLPDIEWHFIGTLQRNKVKYIAPFVSLIHSVDSIELLREINKQGARFQRVIPCLLELHVAKETSKSGFSTDECLTVLNEGEWRNMQYVQICGIMCMATYTTDQKQIAQEFDKANSFFQMAKEQFFSNNDHFRIRSWGMSGDYSIALEHGSNMVRIGTGIFGDREY